MAQEGCLAQVDGSRHNWLEGRRPWLTLVGAIDDATGLVVGATFRDQEDAQGYFQALREVVVSPGGATDLVLGPAPDLREVQEGGADARRATLRPAPADPDGPALRELQVELIRARSRPGQGPH